MSSYIEEVTAWDGVGRAEPQLAAFEYDFAVDGGTVAAHTLRGQGLPSGAVVLDALVKTVTPLASGGAATVALKIEGGADLQAATAFDAAPFAAAGTVHAAAVDRSKAPITLTAARSVVATVAVAALTGGKFVVVVEYIAIQS